MAEQADELTASYYRCRRDDRFLDTFYEGFLSKSPAVAQMFAKTDFKLQKVMLCQSLLEMLCFDREMSGAREEIERLGLRHKELRVTPEMYAMWLDSLCEAIKKHDTNYTPALELLWRKGHAQVNQGNGRGECIQKGPTANKLGHVRGAIRDRAASSAVASRRARLLAMNF
jgi:hemoglobin-like flavoprotein